MNTRNRLPSYTFEGNSVWHYNEQLKQYIKGKILKIDRLQNKVKIKIDTEYLSVIGKLEIDIPIDKLEEASSEKFNSKNIADLRLINTPEILRFFEYVSRSSIPYFQMTRTLVFLSKLGEKIKLDLSKEKYLEIINNFYADPLKDDRDLFSFIATILRSMKKDKKSKQIFLFGKQIESKKSQKIQTFSFIKCLFNENSNSKFQNYEYAINVISYLTQSLDSTGNRKQFGFYKTSYQFNEKTQLIGIEFKLINLYLSFLGSEISTSRFPLLIYFARFFYDEQKPESEFLSANVNRLFSVFSSHEIDGLRAKYQKFKKSLSVNLLDF